MIKQLILLIQVLGLFFYQLIFTGDLTVTQKIPDSITQGTEAVIEITIKKEDITGFAKVQQIFPDGFTAEPIDTKGATFSFKDNKVKFIWMALPAEKEFTISYKIKPNENTIGDFTLGGKFSFISESERKNIEIPIANFKVISDEPLVVETAPEEPLAEEPVIETPIEEPVVEEPVAALVTINCNRSITKIEDGKYKVVVEINKKGIQGFAKITEEIPEGFIAKESDSQGGVFSFKESEAKILWMAIPKSDRYTITYNLEANSGVENGTYSIKGYYSYLENDVTSKYNIDGSNFELNIEQLVVEEPVVAPVIEEPVIEEPVVVEPIITENSNDKVTSTPNPENEVAYKVQVGAGHKTVASNYFSVKFNLKDNVSTINHEGWIKYLVGSFGEYKAARDKRNKVRNNIKTAFVTAYNSGKRITVQEALMISNQKWYK
ncbi:MAG: hypothetical protein COA97_12360 [Flavobacteriales bacterium]|nr:MAG: hypothetical protein COA97_12360 [Flavobacteriales bacterium]